MKKRNNGIFIPGDRKRLLAVVILLFIFFTPYGVKVADMVIHHHFTSHYVQTSETEFSVEGHFCPIPGFKYQSFLNQPAIGEVEGIHFLHKIQILKVQEPFVNRYFFSFSLRAPPLLDNIS